MFWKLLTPDQWSALGTVVSAIAAVLNLVVVIALLIYTRNATASAKAQAEVAVRTLSELDREKDLQTIRETMRVQGRLKDLGDKLLALKQSANTVQFQPSAWEMKPSDWHEMGLTVVGRWPDGKRKVINLEIRLRALDVRLRSLESLSIGDPSFQMGLRDLIEFVEGTEPLVAEVWEGMMNGATYS